MAHEMSYGNDYHDLPLTSIGSGEDYEPISDLLCHTIQIVNICFVGQRGGENWILVDAGMPGSANAIIAAAEKRFGPDSKPQAIILTHGHFDHVGAVIELIEHWDVPVFAHELEMPFLTGKQPYSAPDPTVEGGMVAKLSFWFPNDPINLGNRVEVLPKDHTVPFMPEWNWIHTPGHTPGHVSLFRNIDRSLIAGDAFLTVKQDSVYKVVTQEKEISGPPRYFTTDWKSARDSIRKLHSLNPSLAIAGHGIPMEGEELTENLQILVHDFDRIAIPEYGKYLH